MPIDKPIYKAGDIIDTEVDGVCKIISAIDVYDKNWSVITEGHSVQLIRHSDIIGINKNKDEKLL